MLIVEKDGLMRDSHEKARVSMNGVECEIKMRSDIHSYE